MEIPSNVLGVHVVHKPVPGKFDGIAPNITVDVVAVHGKGAHAGQTWSSRDPDDPTQWVDWLSNPKMLPAALPSARVLRFGYLSAWFGSEAIDARPRSVAHKLLDGLRSHRNDAVHRPLIFVGHSFGGLVVLTALLLAKRDELQNKYAGIHSATVGLVLLGTPLRGTNDVNHTEIVELANSVFDSAPVMTENIRSSKAGNDWLRSLLDDFLGEARSATMRIVCFYEQKPSDLGSYFKRHKKYQDRFAGNPDAHKVLLVAEESACFDIHPPMIEKRARACDHFQMNKFSSALSEEWLTLVEFLEKMEQQGRASNDRGFNEVEMKTAHSIVDDIRFKKMDDRQEKIEEPHDRTFDWMLSEGETPFSQWLCKDHGIFWISGNASSGKSVLMKHLGQHPRTAALLYDWAEQTNPLTASYYFWAPEGVHLLNTPEGMLRGILYQFLTELLKRDNVALVKLATPQPWPEHETPSIRHWTRSQVSDGVDAVIANQKVCIFADGLDECEEARQGLLVAVLRRLSASQNVKICVSSQLCAPFSEAYGDLPRIVLHEHTQRDIYKIVCDKLQLEKPALFSDQIYRDLASEGFKCHPRPPADEEEQATQIVPGSDQKAKDLVDHLAKDTGGNILLVRENLDAVCTRLRHGQSVTDVTNYISLMPSGVKSYFQHKMLPSIAQTYREADGGRYSETAMAFKIACISKSMQRDYMWFGYFWALHNSRQNSQEPQSDNMLSCHDFGQRQEFSFVSAEDLAIRAADTKSFLGGACKGFLHIPDDRLFNATFCDWVESAAVEFTNRTAYDFLMTKDMQTYIDDRIPAHFMTDEFAKELTLLRVKTIQTSKDRSRDWVYKTIDRYLRNSDCTTKMDLFDKALAAILVIFTVDEPGFWHVKDEFDGFGTLIILRSCIEHGLSLCAIAILRSQPNLPLTFRKTDFKHLLVTALGLEKIETTSSPICTIRPDLVRFLLEHGVDPNARSYDMSPEDCLHTWHRLLSNLWQYACMPPSKNTAPLARCDHSDHKIEVVTAMIRSGADLKSKVCVTPGLCHYYGHLDECYLGCKCKMPANEHYLSKPNQWGEHHHCGFGHRKHDLRSVQEVLSSIFGNVYTPIVRDTVLEYTKRSTKSRLRLEKMQWMSNLPDEYVSDDELLFLDRMEALNLRREQRAHRIRTRMELNDSDSEDDEGYVEVHPNQFLMQDLAAFTGEPMAFYGGRDSGQRFC